MMEQLRNSCCPFIPISTTVRESVERVIYGYDVVGFVTKIDKPGRRNRFSSVEKALEEIQHNQSAREEVGQMLEEQGVSSELVSRTKSVIHSDRDGSITYSEIQDWYRKAHSLGQLGFGVLGLSGETLMDLKGIFKADMEFLRFRRKFLDLSGSAETQPRFPISTIKYLFPIFSSENIVIDASGTPKIVDIENFQKYEVHMGKGFKPLVRRNVKLLGSFISLGIINFLRVIKS